jgi:hypothetical protein
MGLAAGGPAVDVVNGILTFVIFAEVILAFGYFAFKGVRFLGKLRLTQEINRSSAPQTLEAVVVGKRVDVTGGARRPEDVTRFQYVTFQAHDGERQEFLIHNGDHQWIEKGTWGVLSYKGLQYTGFQPRNLA